jgi:hypothetical protein
MELQTVPPAAAPKLPYTPPKANFVPLKTDERLFASFTPITPPNCSFSPITPPTCTSS